MTAKTPYRGVLTSVLLLTLTGVLAAAAEEITPSSLPVSEARNLLGEWVLSVDAPGGDMTLVLNFMDIDGKMAATIQSPEQTQAQVITDITEASLALKLRYSAQFGETSTGMTLIVRSLEPGTLTGSLADDLGQLTGNVTSDAKARGLGHFAASVRGTRGGKIPGRTALNLAGREVKVTFGGLRQGSEDRRRFEKVTDGEVFEFASSRATKLFTAWDLTFGSTIIRRGNVSPGFPDYSGVYSLWMKKVGDRWHLVFNEQADIWGTQHDPAFDVAEVPLTLSKSDQVRDRFEIELTKRGDGGLLQVAWGPQLWRVPFTAIR